MLASTTNNVDFKTVDMDRMLGSVLHGLSKEITARKAQIVSDSLPKKYKRAGRPRSRDGTCFLAF